MVAHIQNISQEPQLVRVKGIKMILKPGEVAECEESEKSIAKTYKSLFAVVDPATPRTVELKAPVVEEGSIDYTKLKQPALLNLCVDRGIGVKPGVNKNADLVTLLEEYDAKVNEAPVVEEKTDEEKTSEPGAESIAE